MTTSGTPGSDRRARKAGLAGLFLLMASALGVVTVPDRIIPPVAEFTGILSGLTLVFGLAVMLDRQRRTIAERVREAADHRLIDFARNDKPHPSPSA